MTIRTNPLRFLCVLSLTSTVLLASAPLAFAEQKPKPAPKTGAADILPTQVLLDRAGFSPGEIDGRGGRNTENAIRAFEKANNTTIAEALAAAEPPTITYTISAQDVSVPTVAAIPEDMMEKAKLKKLEYTSVLEMLAERFHAAPALLKRLNASAKFAEGEQITVPNVNVVSEAEGKRVIAQAVESVAKRLGNTKAVCRKCYIHPAVLDAYLDGSILQQRIRAVRKTGGLSQAEAAVLTLLQRRLATRGGKRRASAVA